MGHLAASARGVALALLALSIQAGLGAVVPRLCGRAVDAALSPHPDRATLGAAALLVLGAAAAQCAIALAARGALEAAAHRLERSAREEVIERLLLREARPPADRRTGDLTAQIVHEAQRLRALISPAGGLLAESLLAPAAALLMSAHLDARLAAVPALFLAATMVATRSFARRIVPAVEGSLDSFRRMSGAASESLTAIELVKALGAEPGQMARFDEAAVASRAAMVAQARARAAYLPPLLFGAALALAFLHAATLHREGALSLGGVVAYLGLLSTLRAPARVYEVVGPRLQAAAAAARRLSTLFADAAPHAPAGKARRAEIRGELVFEDVWLHAGERALLRGVSFRVAPGETLALVGPTGSGKTLLGQLVNGTLEPSAGRILLDGVDLRDWSLDSLRAQVGVVEQDLFLFSGSIRDNIALGKRDGASQAEVERAARDACADGFITALHGGYDAQIGERGVTLSGGQRQRIAIARALINAPRLLVLDDAASALDASTEREVGAAVERAMRGRTTLLITHRAARIASADHVVLLSGGRVIDQGSPRELAARSAMFRRIYGDAAPPEAP